MTLNIHQDYVVEAGQTLSFSDVPNTESAIEFKAKGQPLILENFGTIDVDNSPRWAIHSTRQQGPDVFWNHVGAVLQVEWTDGSNLVQGVELESDGSQVRNDGTIELSGTWAEGIRLPGDNSRLLNTGDINISATEYGLAIYAGSFAKNTGHITVQSGDVTNACWVTREFVNTGQIRAEADHFARGLFVDASWADQSPPGIDVTIKNSGSIIAISHDVAHPSQAIVFTNPDEEPEVRIENSGHMEGDTIFGDINEDWTPRLYVDNSGELVGQVFFSFTGGVLNNTGSIIGDVAFGQRADIYRGGHGHLTGSVDGGWGDDKLTGGIEGNVFYGDLTAPDARDGNDLLRGRGGDDTLHGGGGDDTLSGGTGTDLLTGDTGNDTFRFEGVGVSTPAASDLITDLHPGDIIDLHQIDANTTQDGDQAFVLVGSFSGNAGELVMSYDSSAGVTLLEGDVDGDGQSDFEIRMSGDHTGFTGIVV